VQSSQSQLKLLNHQIPKLHDSIYHFSPDDLNLLGDDEFSGWFPVHISTPLPPAIPVRSKAVNSKSKIKLKIPHQLSVKQNATSEADVSACIILFVHTEEFPQIRTTLRSLHSRFNKNYKYPYLIVSNASIPSSLRIILSWETPGTEIKYIHIDEQDLKPPSWIQLDSVATVMKKMDGDGVMYGGNIYFRKAARWYVNSE
jgi:hypothetical protein